jgi:transcriptional regulator with XRE-family HTH domain
MKNQEQMGINLKKARETLDLTQAEVAKKVGINVNYYARIERGEEVPSLDTLESLVKVLKVKSSQILPF